MAARSRRFFGPAGNPGGTAPIYVAPAGYVALIRMLSVVRPTGGLGSETLVVMINGRTATNVVDRISLAGLNAVSLDRRWVLNAGDELHVSASAADLFTIAVFGYLFVA